MGYNPGKLLVTPNGIVTCFLSIHAECFKLTLQHGFEISAAKLPSSSAWDLDLLYKLRTGKTLCFASDAVLVSGEQQFAHMKFL